MSIFQARLRQLLDEKNLRPADVAKKTKISKTTISKYLSVEDKNIRATFLLKIAQFFDVAPEWLYGESEQRRPFYEPELSEIYKNLSDSGRKELCNYAAYLLEREEMRGY